MSINLGISLLLFKLLKQYLGYLAFICVVIIILEFFIILILLAFYLNVEALLLINPFHITNGIISLSVSSGV